MTFPIFACSNNLDTYTYDSSMRRLGSFTINIDDPSMVDDKYSFSVSFMFGTTELTVSAVDDMTKKQAQLEVTFVAE